MKRHARRRAIAYPQVDTVTHFLDGTYSIRPIKYRQAYQEIMINARGGFLRFLIPLSQTLK